MSTGLLDGKVVFIAGVGEGLGRDLALAAAEFGADVAMAARRPDLIEPIAREVEARGRRGLPLLCDVTRPEQCERAVDEACRTLGRIDSLIHVAYLSDKRLSLLDTPDDFADWRATFDMNVFAALGMVRAAARRMVEQRLGAIVMINSMAAERLLPGRSGYAGSKAAQAKMAQVVALELAPHGVRINSLHPGYMAGEPVERSFRMFAEKFGTDVETERQKVLSTIPLGYIPPTSEYARVALFLASDLSAPITGQSIHANGGQWLR